MKASVAILAFSAAALTAEAAVIQVGTGGTTDPGLSPDGSFVGQDLAVSIDSAAFTTVGLWDGGSATVGGGAVSGTLYYAWTARALDREGQPGFLPSGLSPTGALNPGSSFGGGQIYRGGGEIFGVGNNYDAYAFSTFGLGGNGDLSPRVDLHPSATITFLAEVIFNAGADDQINVTAYWGDPSAPISTHSRNVSGDASFDEWRFRSGHQSTTTNNRWEFSDVAFATSAAEALAAIPEPSVTLLAGLGAVCLLRRRRSGDR